MRELVFALEYEPGCDRVADTLADHPDARIRSLSLHATAERLDVPRSTLAYHRGDPGGAGGPHRHPVGPSRLHVRAGSGVLAPSSVPTAPTDRRPATGP